MHEWGLADSVVKRIQSEALKNNIKEVKKAGVILGRAQGISKEEFIFCLNAKTKEHNLKDISFDIKEEDSSAVGVEYIEG
jgi:Zn finger protein HypA/HybF involved in hydrogenase expression